LKLPRDLSGRELVQLLRRYGYVAVREEGSHIRLVSSFRGTPHHITVPDHPELKIGTLRAVLRLVSEYLEMDSATLMQKLFER
jgi:predicted RNA binding protein YcfA (HicA-like mRNA interferase family)